MRFILSIMIGIFFLVGCESKGVYKEGNLQQKPLKFKAGEVEDIICMMSVDSKEHSVQVALKNGVTYIFDDAGCFSKWYEKQSDEVKKSAKFWAYSDDTKRYIDATKAWYKLGVHTPMHYGFGVYENKPKGAVDFDEFLLMMKRGENLTNPKIRKRVLGL